MAKPKLVISATNRSPLKWAAGWDRVPIGERKPKAVWKKPFSYYREALILELSKIGVSEIMISFNEGEDARRDPGVTIYFSKPLKEDFSWQMALGLNNPAPTIAEIDAAYRDKVGPVHPDRPANNGGDVEKYIALGKHREQAYAWVRNTHRAEHEYGLPCDRFTEPRWNLNALRLGLGALRKLEEYGLPGMLERSFRGYRVQLAERSEVSDVQQSATA